MTKPTCLLLFILGSAAAAVSGARAQEPKSIRLPDPDLSGGKPLMQALRERKTSREFDTQPLPVQVLADLLWSAFGINRPATKGRTAPSAMNAQEIDVYVALASGLYRYEAVKNSLEFVSPEDIRAVTGTQAFVKDAPVDLVYVADFARAKKFGERKEFLAAADAGFISQNVYLYCASSGLATGVRASFDERTLAAALHLESGQKIILAQAVGYSKAPASFPKSVGQPERK
jgi:SagB-type dehydrogenase family enzyme